MSNLRAVPDPDAYAEMITDVMRNRRTPHRWETYELSEALGIFLRAQKRAGMSKWLQTECGIAESTAEKLIRGVLPHISAALLLNIDRMFNGELFRVLRGLPKPEDASARIRELAREIRELADL